MKKLMTVSIIALAAFGGAYAFAQGAPDRGAGDRRPPMMRFSPEDRAAMLEGRIAAAKAVLKLTPEQERNWPAFETALRDMGKQQQARMEERMKRAEERRAAGRDNRPAPVNDPVAQLRERAARMTENGQTLQKLADASGPLYASLDEAQKRRFTMITGRMGAGRGGHHRADFDGPHGRGPGGMDGHHRGGGMRQDGPGGRL